MLLVADVSVTAVVAEEFVVMVVSVCGNGG